MIDRQHRSQAVKSQPKESDIRRVIVSGPCEILTLGGEKPGCPDSDYEDGDPMRELPSMSQLSAMHGRTFTEPNEAFSLDYHEKELSALSGGYLRFEFNTADKLLYAVVEFYSSKQLSNVECKCLKERLQSQFSDGHGDSLRQHYDLWIVGYPKAKAMNVEQA